MISPAREVCYQIMKLIEIERLNCDDALNSPIMQGLEIRDRHLVTEIVYGSLRWQATLDYILAGVATRPWNQIPSGAKILLRISLYQLWQMDRIPDHAVVNDAVELAKNELGRGISRYINAVLRRLARERPWENQNEFLRAAPPWIRASLPKWLWQRWVGRYGVSNAMDYALSLNVPPRPAIRLDSGKQETAFPAATPSDLVPDAWIVTSSGAELARSDFGHFDYQDEASQLIPHLLGSIQGWRVWDVCAAPGGKYAILRRKCGPEGKVIASDLRWERIRLLVKSIKDYRAEDFYIVQADVTRPAPFRCCFNAVLADVPCSGLGTLRRNPEIKWRFRPPRLVSLQATQKRILDSVCESVCVGGYLLYSTCSTEPEENEQVVEYFLQTHPSFSLQRPEYPPGIEAWVGPDRMVRTFPSSRPWDGFFAALLKRCS